MSTFKPMEKASPADRIQHHSYFKTTFKYQFYHWFSSLIILPTYFTIIHLLLSSLEMRLCPSVNACTSAILQQSWFTISYIIHWIYWVITISVMLPSILSLTAVNRPWWRSGFRFRGQLIFICSILSLYIEANLLPISSFAGVYFVNFADFTNNNSINQLYLGIFALLVIYGCVIGFLLLKTDSRRNVLLISALIGSLLFLVYRSFDSIASASLEYGYIILRVSSLLPSLMSII